MRACGGYLNGFIAQASEMYLEDLIEYLEIVTEIHADPKEAGTELWDTLQGSLH